jgi:hypothetical protein
MTNANEPINVLRGANNRVLTQDDFDGWNEAYKPIIGLTKREYFAALALQGMMANPALYTIASQNLNPNEFPKFYAQCVIEHVDALIEQLNKTIKLIPMAKVQKITVENLKAVSKMTATFNGCTAIIVGGNNKGKSSFLKSLPERMRGNKTDLILKKGEKEGFAEWELTTGEKFIWSFDGKKEKMVFISERNIKQSVTKDLCNAYFPKVFDVDKFLSDTPAKQTETLKKLSGIDFSELDRVYQAAYEERTYANKKVAEAKALLTDIDTNLPKEPLPTIELENKLANISSHNQIWLNKNEQFKTKQQLVSDNEKEIEALKQKIKMLEQKNSVLNGEIFELDAWLDDENNKLILESTTIALRNDLLQIRTKNNEIEANNKAFQQQLIYDKAVENAAIADKEVKRIEAEKVDAIKSSALPEGFSFNNDGITYNGFPFNKEQLSSSGIYIAALKLAAIGLGEVKTLHFDASYLDKNSLAEIEKWANDNDLQLLIERPDYDAGEIRYELINEPAN